MLFVLVLLLVSAPAAPVSASRIQGKKETKTKEKTIGWEVYGTVSRGWIGDKGNWGVAWCVEGFSYKIGM